MTANSIVKRMKNPLSFSFREWLLISCGFACLLVLIRFLATGSAMYIFLPWNLFLAFVPYQITRWMIRRVQPAKNDWLFYVGFIAWILFIPNSFYIITDLFHLSRPRKAPQWFDVLLIFSFAWNGIILGVISLRQMEIVVTTMGGARFGGLLIPAVMWLSGLGIYIGRFLRYNSWDILTNPFSLLSDMLYLVVHPLQNGYAWGMTICYAVFMSLLYFTIKKLGETFIAPK